MDSICGLDIGLHENITASSRAEPDSLRAGNDDPVSPLLFGLVERLVGALKHLLQRFTDSQSRNAKAGSHLNLVPEIVKCDFQPQFFSDRRGVPKIGKTAVENCNLRIRVRDYGD